ncbi:MAG: C40 family peptidase [Clostridiales bacterium]|nr:C40 family peptidase [Clostridiales bacterium]
MRKDKALKAAVCIASIGLLLSIPTATARAEGSIPIEQGVAGISTSLDNYYMSRSDETEDSAEKALSVILNTQIISPYNNLGVSIADSYVNIRKEPTTESEVVGKLYRGCATDILERLEGDWVKIESGDVKGYIASNYLAIGKDAEDMFDEYATKYATVTGKGVRVREAQSLDSKILTFVPEGETYVVIKEYEEWAEILIGNDDSENVEITGFVSKDYLSIDIKFKYAISIEEENRIRRMQEEAERAEAERQAQLEREREEKRKAEEAAKKAAEEAARKAAEEAARKAQEEANKAQKDSSSNNTSDSSSSSSSSSSNSSKSSSDLNKLRQEVVNYALKFVGGRYVYGGNSLTSGVDCSGFVKEIYEDFDIKISQRRSVDQARSAGVRVNVGDRLPGDLIFYANSSGTVNHVALYIGNDRIVHAANSREGIITSRYNYRDIYCVRRIIN